MPAPPSCYTDYKTYDGTDLTDVLIPGGRYMRIVDRFKYLGSWIARNGNDTLDVVIGREGTDPAHLACLSTRYLNKETPLYFYFSLSSSVRTPRR